MLLKKVLGWVFLSIGIISGIITITQWIGYLNIIGVIRKMFDFFLIKVALFWVTISISESFDVTHLLNFRDMKKKSGSHEINRELLSAQSQAIGIPNLQIDFMSYEKEFRFHRRAHGIRGLVY